MRNRALTTILWIVGIAATAYLANGQSFAPMLVIILVILAGVNISLVREEN